MTKTILYFQVWTETENYLASSTTRTEQEIFQNAISTLAQFTALSVERFHKTAELLLVKERRSTVNEADALVQLTNVLSNQISLLANSFCDTLHRFAETTKKSDINENITTIFLEVSNWLNNSSIMMIVILKTLFSHRLQMQIHIFKMPLDFLFLFYKLVQSNE